MKHGQHGFTLLELMMVVVIIGILATIALPGYFKSSERARTGEILQVLASIRGAESRHFALNSVYTATTADLDVDVPAMTNWAAPTVDVPGKNVCAARTGTGPTGGAVISINIETGKTCASTVAAQAQWGTQAQLACGACL